MTDPSKTPAQWRGNCLGLSLAGLSLALAPACLPYGPERPEPKWDPRPLIVEQAFERFPKLDAADMDWCEPEPLADTGLETWVWEGPYDWGWLTTSWTVDPIKQTAGLDWQKMKAIGPAVSAEPMDPKGGLY